MKLWFTEPRGPKTLVCVQCAHVFVPPEYEADDAPFRDYCKEHRAPLLKLAARKNDVLAWAETNWERLEGQMQAEWGAVPCGQRNTNPPPLSAEEMNSLAENMRYDLQNVGACFGSSLFQNAASGLGASWGGFQRSGQAQDDPKDKP